MENCKGNARGCDGGKEKIRTSHDIVRKNIGEMLYT